MIYNEKAIIEILCGHIKGLSYARHIGSDMITIHLLSREIYCGNFSETKAFLLGLTTYQKLLD